MKGVAAGHPDIDALARAWLDQADTPFAIVDQDLTLHWVNRAAHMELAAQRALENKDGVLATLDASRQTKLQQFVRAVKRTMSTWCLPCDDGQVLFRGMEIQRDHLNRYIALRFFATATFTPIYADLDRAFDLTGREHGILQALMASQRPEEIAHDLGLRVPTVRTHIRNLYDKLDVTCREELFRRVSPFRVA